MLISFYHISLCPRCARARKHLKDLLGDSYSVLVIEKNILSQPGEAWKNGIRMVPTVKSGDTVLSGVLLSRESIKQFLDQNGYAPSSKC